MSAESAGAVLSESSGAVRSESSGAVLSESSGAVRSESSGKDGGAALAGPAGADAAARDGVAAARAREWAALGEWLASPPPLLHKVDLEVLQERLGFMGRARSSLAAAEADVIAEISRREGDAVAEETVRRAQKRSRAGARKAVRTATQLEWAPRVAGKLADGAITPEAANLILDAAGETPVDHDVLLEAAESEPDDLFRRTLKEHVNERTSEQELEARRARQRRRRRASISEEPDGMFHLFAQFDPLTGNRVRNALLAKTDALFRTEDPKNRATSPQRFADALTELICNNSGAGRPGTGDGSGVPAGVELLVLADYDQVRDEITNARLADDTRLTEAEALALACDAKILPGIFNKHTGDAVLGRSKRKIPKWLRKQLVARDGGCVGCGAHHKICQVHHIRHWKHGGETTLRTPAWCAGAATTSASTKTAKRSPATPEANSPSAHQPTPTAPKHDHTRHPATGTGKLRTMPQEHRPQRAPAAGADRSDPSHPPPRNGHRPDPALPQEHRPQRAPAAGADRSDPSHPPPRNGHRPDPALPQEHRPQRAPVAGADRPDPSHPPPRNGHSGSRRGTGRRRASPSSRPPATLF